MFDNKLEAAQQEDYIDKGKVLLAVTDESGYMPIEGAKIKLMETSQERKVIEELSTNSSGQTTELELATPPLEWSLEPGERRPYALYDFEIEAPGYEKVLVEGTELLANVTARQPVRMKKLPGDGAEEIVEIGPHTLYGNYPAKIPEEEIKEEGETGEIVLSRVVIPETVVVHDGAPSSKAKNYFVSYKDYIKNVVSSEIYATWPESTIIANTLCILSFTMNRVYTEWYRGKGYDFTITSSTAYDQKWIYGRNIYDNISRIVDSIFSNYLSRPGIKQPLFASYCDGQKVNCQGLKQWGSKNLGQQGYSATEILKYYYGSDIYINTSEYIAGIPASWPGNNLGLGASGDKVRQLQQQLLRIRKNYPAIPELTADGKYGPKTAAAVRSFQGIFDLPQTGVTDYATWYAISNIYVGVTRISEPGAY